MVAKTYYSLFSTGVTVFAGFVTNTGTQCATPSGSAPFMGQLSTVNTLCTGSSPRLNSTAPATNHLQFAVGGFTAATVVSAATWQIWIRKASTKQFWLEAYNAAGVKQAGGLGPISITGSSIMANAAWTGSLTVPANGFLAVRCGFTGASNRFYFGVNPKSNGLPSAVLTTTQLPAQTVPIANASGTLVLGGSGSGSVEQPSIRYFCASIRMADGTAAPNGITVYLHALNGDKVVKYPTGVVTSNHPTGHPTYATTETGWVCFNHTALLADQTNHHLTILPQAAVGLESGVSIEVIPQVTANGNG